VGFMLAPSLLHVPPESEFAPKALSYGFID